MAFDDPLNIAYDALTHNLSEGEEVVWFLKDTIDRNYGVFFPVASRETVMGTGLEAFMRAYEAALAVGTANFTHSEKTPQEYEYAINLGWIQEINGDRMKSFKPTTRGIRAFTECTRRPLTCRLNGDRR